MSMFDFGDEVKVKQLSIVCPTTNTKKGGAIVSTLQAVYALP
jgi:hypothetical protein